MASLNIPAIKKDATENELRLFVIRLAEEICYALDELSRSYSEETEAKVLSNKALFLSEELKSLVNMQSGEGYISFGSVSVCFGKISFTSGAEKALALPLSYKGDYFSVVTPTGNNCNGVSLYIKAKQNTGFTVGSSGGSGSITADYITIGQRKGG